MKPQEIEEVKRVKKVMNLIRCPRCGFKFSILYSRAVACLGCRQSVLRCPRIRCPRCDHEFAMKGTLAGLNYSSTKALARQLSSFLKKDQKAFGDRFA